MDLLSGVDVWRPIRVMYTYRQIDRQIDNGNQPPIIMIISSAFLGWGVQKGRISFMTINCYSINISEYKIIYTVLFIILNVLEKIFIYFKENVNFIVEEFKRQSQRKEEILMIQLMKQLGIDKTGKSIF